MLEKTVFLHLKARLFNRFCSLVIHLGLEARRRSHIYIPPTLSLWILRRSLSVLVISFTSYCLFVWVSFPKMLLLKGKILQLLSCRKILLSGPNLLFQKIWLRMKPRTPKQIAQFFLKTWLVFRFEIWIILKI